VTEPPTPFNEHRDVVRPEWIDDNAHFNMGYYVVAFDLATDRWLAHIGLSDEEKARLGVTTFSLESHVTYLRELFQGAPLRFETRLLGFDDKRIHFYHEMYHAEDGFLAATNELMSLHVERATRRGAAMAPEVVARLAEVWAGHRQLPRPSQIGRRVGLDQKPGRGSGAGTGDEA